MGVVLPRFKPKAGGATARERERETARTKSDQRPADPEAERRWRDWFDAEKTSIRVVMESFTITTDERAEQATDDRGTSQVKMTLRPKQLETLTTIEDVFWNLERRAARIMFLKARRYGMTTFFMLLGLERILRCPGYNVALVAQDDDTAREQFSVINEWLLQIPDWVWHVVGVEIARNRDNLVVLRHSNGQFSRFRVATAKRNALGRGLRNNMLILTEFPQWPKKAKEDLSGILRTCKNRRGNLIVFESTAKGYEEFYNRCKAAWEGQSSYRFLFVGSHENPDNRRKFKDDAERAAFDESLGKKDEFGGEAERILFDRLVKEEKWDVEAASQYVNWRRFALFDECDGYLTVLDREEPCTPAAAFAGSGFPVFRKDVLDAWRPLAEKRDAAAMRGALRRKNDRDVEFVSKSSGDWLIYERPKRESTYELDAFCWGSDAATGQTTTQTRDPDWSICNVKEVHTGRTVAFYRQRVRATELAEEVFKAAYWYAHGTKDVECRGMPERNPPGDVVINRLEGIEFGDMVGNEMMYGQQVEVFSDSSRKKYQFRAGHYTSSKTKPLLIERLADFIDEIGPPKLDGTDICPWTTRTIDECLKFEKDPLSRSMEASSGHDDCVMAEALALEARAQYRRDWVAPEPKSDAKPDGMTVLLRHSVGRAEQERLDGSLDVEDTNYSLPGY